MKPSAKQVAHAAGVSLSAVSRAFMPGTSLDEGKRRRVLAAAADLGYVSPARRTADAIAAGSVSLVTGDLANPFYPAMLEALATRVRRGGQQLLVYALPAGTTVDDAMGSILAARPRAVIVASAHLTSKLASACRQHGIKIVLFNRIQLDVRADAVTCDNYGGGRDAGSHLILRGRRRFGFIAGLPGTSTHVERARGFRDRLEESGHELVFEIGGGFSYPVAFAAATSLLRRPDRPDALFCCNDIMALAAMDAARELGLHIPEDIAVVGFDDIPMAGWISYQLTTIRQPVQHMVDEAMDLIDGARKATIGEGRLRILPGDLVLRASA